MDIHVATHEQHHEQDVSMTKTLLGKLKSLLEDCNKETDSLCSMSIPRNAKLIKIHLEQNSQGAIKLMGIYMKQREGGEREDALRITFLLKNTNRRSVRSNDIKRPLNNFQRIKTTPKGLVVIGVIRPTKKPVTKSLGRITPTTKPRLVFTNQQINHVFMKIPKTSKGKMNTLLKKVVDGFSSVRKQMV